MKHIGQVNHLEGDLRSLQHTEGPEFDATLWMAIADSWWDLGRRSAPLIGDTLLAEQRDGYLSAWAKAVHEGAEGDEDVIAAVTPAALDTFVRTALGLLERKYGGGAIAEELQRLVEPAKYRISDDGKLLRFDESPEAFWAWEYVFLFQDLKYEEAGWLTAVGRCERCDAFFIKSRKDQRFHSDACRKHVANKRFYKNRGRNKRRH